MPRSSRCVTQPFLHPSSTDKIVPPFSRLGVRPCAVFPVQGHHHPRRRGGGDALGAGGHATRPQPVAVHAHGVPEGKRRVFFRDLEVW